MNEAGRSESLRNRDDGPTQFGVDPRAPNRRVWHQARWSALLSGAALLMIAVTTLLVTGAAAYLAWTMRDPGDWVGVAILTIAGLVAATMTVFAWREWRARRSGTIVIEDDTITLKLPAGRSPIHRLGGIGERLALSQIAAIETRLEDYGQMRQRAYRLRRKDGPVIYLFEDRALGTPGEKPSLMPVASEIAHAAGLGVTELPRAEGEPRFLGRMLGRPYEAAPG